MDKGDNACPGPHPKTPRGGILVTMGSCGMVGMAGVVS